jgi:hypothetical protein
MSSLDAACEIQGFDASISRISLRCIRATRFGDKVFSHNVRPWQVW